MLLFVLFFVSLSIFCSTQTILENNDEVEEMHKKEEFRKWFLKIKDPFYDGCGPQLSIDLNNTNKNSHLTNDRQKTINVVKCSSGRGKSNYRIKVIIFLANNC